MKYSEMWLIEEEKVFDYVQEKTKEGYEVKTKGRVKDGRFIVELLKELKEESNEI